MTVIPSRRAGAQLSASEEFPAPVSDSRAGSNGRCNACINFGRVLLSDSTLARGAAARCQKESLKIEVQQSVIDDLPIPARWLQEMTVAISKFVH